MDTPLEVIIFKALEKRKTHAIGAKVWVRNPVTRQALQYDVIGVLVAMTTATQFALNYLVAPLNALRPFGRFIVSEHDVHDSYEAASISYDPTASDKIDPVDPVDYVIEAAVLYHRNRLRNPNCVRLRAGVTE